MTATGNADYTWNLFDSEAYFQHYYGEPHVDDENVIRHACAAIQAAAPSDARLDVVDIGTGPNLFPLMCALPRAARLTAWEFSQSNVAWLEGELEASAMRPQWRHFWDVVRRSHPGSPGLPDNPMEDLRRRTTVRQGSIFELPRAAWDAATMFFCAESITGDRNEFHRACRSFALSVKPGGTLIAAFLVGSAGYEVAERPFPVLDISEADILAFFEPLTSDLRTERIGIVEKEIRSGYAGMVFLSAKLTANAAD